MSDDVIVTVGICARNEEHVITHAINSVLKQRFPKNKMEIIIVDDGSEDNTLPIIQKYVQEGNIDYTIFTGARLGLGKARNLVINNAKGRYILWVDADMIIPPEFIEKQVRFMEKNPRVGIAGAQFFGYPEKKLLVIAQNLEWIAMNRLIENNDNLNTPAAVQGGAIFRTEAAREIGGFDKSIIGAGEDEEIEKRILEAGWQVHKGTDAYFYEIRKNTWKAIWDQFFWYGRGSHYMIHKRIRRVNPSRIFDAFSLSAIAYKITGKKQAFLIPIQYYFKVLAWYAGYINAHFEGYGH